MKCFNKNSLSHYSIRGLAARLQWSTEQQMGLGLGRALIARSAASSWGLLTMTTTAIRPALTSLRLLPTIHQVSESWGKLELKLETEDTRYWITTEGVPHKTSGTPINYVVGYVTVEKLNPDGSWDLKAVYSPEAWKLSQGFDYCQLLYQELNRLKEQLGEHFSWEIAREIDIVERELEQTNRAVFELSERVRSRWA
jgi:hypothetical protein